MTGLPPLDPDSRMDIEAILTGLEAYRPRRTGWVWRDVPPDGVRMGPFTFRDMAAPLARGVPLPAARHFGGIDPQPRCVVTTEIASGRFEDDLRRMRMAAWHGADHVMVIRTTGQSHIDGLLEGTPEGIGGVPITRKQIRATRRALDLIEDEVGRPINLHSYVSGVAGPEVAVLFAEEGVNGAHQDPQYNVLYRNINMIRSYVDAAEAKRVLAGAGILQIDGAHNANATARHGWAVLPELLVQHGINSAFSVAAGMSPDLIGLSTVPPNAAPAPKLWYDLPYAVALRDMFPGYRIRAQQNTRYVEADLDEALRTHTVDTLISILTGADIQSTITPDEGRNVPWHHSNIRALRTVKQTWAALDGIGDLVRLDRTGPLGAMVSDIKRRAVVFLEEMLATGGYLTAVQAGFFVDSAAYPERAGDGIARRVDGGVAAGTVVPRDPDYLAPVCGHFGDNKQAGRKPCDPIGGCTLCDPAKIAYLGELDPEDTAERRLRGTRPFRGGDVLLPEAEWSGDGVVLVQLTVPDAPEYARAAALEMARGMRLADPEVVSLTVLHAAEGCFVEVKGRVTRGIDRRSLRPRRRADRLDDDELRAEVARLGLVVVAGTVGEDEHSVGLREILDVKHGGIEAYGVRYHYLGTSVPVGKLIDAAVETGAAAILMSTIISHSDIHRTRMRALDELCRERGVRDRLVLIAGGTQVNPDMAAETGLDATFGRGTRGADVVDALVRLLRVRERAA